MQPFRLRAIDNISSGEIRAVTTLQNNPNFSAALGSLDSNIYLLDHDYKLAKTITAHDKAVSSLVSFPDGSFASGGRDGFLIFHTDSQPLKIKAHPANICYLGYLGDNSLITSSWDGLAKVFKNQKETLVLECDDKCFWSLLPLGNDIMGISTDSSITVFDPTGTIKAKYPKIAPSIPRSSILTNDSILISFQDGTVQRWTPTQPMQCIETYQITDVPIYSMEVIGNLLALGTDDNCVYFFDLESKELYDILPLPGMVWSIQKTLNNDLVVGCSNGSVYVLSQTHFDSSLDELLINAFKDRTFRNEALQEINPFLLQNYYSLDTADIHYGHFELFREGFKKVLCAFNRGMNAWIRVGLLVNKEVHKFYDSQGNAYDFKITVMVDDNTSFPLFCDKTDNPNQVAERFIREHNLGVNFIPQIVDYLKQNLQFGSEIKPIDSQSIGRAAFAQTIGKQPTLDERVVCCELGGATLLGLFDGHGGGKASDFASKRVPALIEENLGKGPKEALMEAFAGVQQEMTEGYETLGTSALVALLIEGRAIIASMGNSRALWVNEEGGVTRVTKEHTPDEEKEYIEAHGGHVEGGLLEGKIFLSRALGDTQFGEKMNRNPDIFEVEIGEKDRFVVLECNDVWRNVSDENIGKAAIDAESPIDLAESIREITLEAKCEKNVSVIVAALNI